MLDCKNFIRPTSSTPGFLRKEGHPEVLYKPVQPGVKGPREVMFYETMFGGESWCIVWSCDYHLTVSHALASVCINVHCVSSEGSLLPSLPPASVPHSPLSSLPPPSFPPSPCLRPSLPHSPPSSLLDDINVESLPEDIQQLRTIIPRYLGTANIRDRAGHIRILFKPLFWNAVAVGYQHIHKQSWELFMPVVYAIHEWLIHNCCVNIFTGPINPFSHLYIMAHMLWQASPKS